MRSITNKIFKTLAITGLMLASGASQAVDVYLQTQAYVKTIPTSATTSQDVPMWGFALCDVNWQNCSLAANQQSAQLNLTTADTLTIKLMNTLSTPVSIVVPGQNAGGQPVMEADGQGRLRVRSFVQETAAGGTSDYVWNSLLAGTYLYQSGTHPSIQVPMGLFGAMVVTPATANAACELGQASAYDSQNSCFDQDSVVLFSEIDPVQNAAVAAALDVASYPSTINYNPSFFLTNGTLFADLPSAVSGEKVLVRLINAGLRSHSPSFVGLEMGLIAEDANLYPGLTRTQSTALLPAGKTRDAILNIPFAGDGVTPANITFSLFDRMPTFSNEELLDGNAAGGLIVGNGSPPATSQLEANLSFSIVEDTPSLLSIPAATNLSVISDVTNGTLVVTNGTNVQYEYIPNPDFSGVDHFTYYDQDNNTTYHVTLNVSFVNDVPVAAGDDYTNIKGAGITVAAPGILANDSDIDGDSLTAVISGTAPAGLTLNADGSFSYTGPDTTFSYIATDGTAQSLPVTVTLTVNPVSNITLRVEDPDAPGVLLTDYRWTLEENAMWHPDPLAPPPAESLGTSFHKSYMPVVAQGVGAAEFAQLALDPTKHYYVTVLPATAATGQGHTLGAAQLPAGATEVTVQVNAQPLPYAQISMYVFEDNSPTNGAVDGAELQGGLGNFQVILEDAGGRYGISGGPLAADADGNPLTNSLDCFGNAQPPRGVILSCPDTPENAAAGLVGKVLIKNLYPGKYGVITTPPAGAGNWVQTSTIEGTKVIDAWVKAGEPAFFQEFGPGSWHVFVGFVNPDRLNLPPGGTNTVTGKVTNFHLSRPPNQVIVDSGSYAALSHTRAWVGINSAGGTGENIAVVQADPDGSFTIPNIPDGIYQLVVWDNYLDQVIAYRGLLLPGGGNVGNMPVFNWFTRSEHNVFLDTDQDGYRDVGEEPIAEQVINLRWRDGTINQSFPTDTEGFAPFDETFPFFHWQVIEVDYTRFKATGVTVTVDAGGDVSGSGGIPGRDYTGILAPQKQGVCTQADVDNNLNNCTAVNDAYYTRTETGPVLSQGFQGFLGQTSVFDWGKVAYAPGENGGISGIVYYSSTRGENDPRLAVGEPWEPGVPSVKVRLYKQVTTATGATSLALIQETETDSWDNNLPTGCPGSDPTDSLITNGVADKCYDGLRNFNQARPAVFDGGYAFTDIEPGEYVVEVVPPQGYELLKEEDNNVSFGDVFANVPAAVVLPNGAAVFGVIPDPATLAAANFKPGLAQPECVGADRTVPDILSLFPSENAEAPFAGSIRPLCDRKAVSLPDQGQAVADFFLFTSAPIAGHFAGMILDDLAQEFNVYSPQFGEKYAPPYVPVSIRDHKGQEISRVYSDQWGRMNGLVPSTFTANMASPSGYSPAMLMTCMNDPGPIMDTRAGSATQGQMIVDPQYNPAYSNFCYTFQYMPGTTTYLDTPVLPVSAFASGYNPVDCSLDEGTPMIHRVDTDQGFGPLVAPNGTITITSRGSVVVPNPAYEGPLGTGLAAQKSIIKDYGFGASQGTGSVTMGDTILTVQSWTDSSITVTAPATEMTEELVITRSNGNSTEHSITMTVSNDQPIRVAAGTSIQDAIDVAAAGDIILVEPGTYNELVIMWKPVKLQGAGAGSTFINSVKRPTEILESWRIKMDCLYGIGDASCTQRADVLPNQPKGAAGFTSEEGAAITVIAVLDDGEDDRPLNSFYSNRARIDGFSITGGDIGGGIYVNGYAHRLEISNNHVFGNNGLYAGGIRIGRPFLELKGDGPFEFNRKIKIHHNSITQNGGLGGAGGGLSILTGTDRYKVTDNFICGNFTTGDGAGIGHLGLSDRGKIENNRILFNQSFSQANTRSGGGILIAGEPGGNGLTLGSGDVKIISNLIQGNQAGAGHGGGIRTQYVNGQDILNSIKDNGKVRTKRWHTIKIENNMIINNVAGWSGAGISMQDTARSFVVNNTIAHNDSTATVAAAFTTPNQPNISVNAPAGISSEPHTIALQNAIPAKNNTNDYREFSNPTLLNNIIWQNRSFHYDATLPGGAGLVPVLSQASVGECVANANYDDLGVLGNQFSLNPKSSVLTNVTGYDASNISNDPLLVNAYCNGGRTLDTTPGVMMALPAVDEGGATWIDVRYGPITPTWSAGGAQWDYHLSAGSPAIDSGDPEDAPDEDYDNQPRPMGAGFDIGADEYTSTALLGGKVSYSSGDFGEVDLTLTETIVITASISDAPVSFTSSSNPAAPFAKIADTCTGNTIAVGDTCSFTLTFSPVDTGISDGALFVENNSIDGSPQSIALTGIGITPQGVLTFTSSSPFPLNADGTKLDFGDLEDGNVETTITLTASNYPVSVGNIDVTGNRYSLSTEDDGNLCTGVTLNAGDTCTITITFNADGDKKRKGKVSVTHNGVNSPSKLKLKGK